MKRTHRFEPHAINCETRHDGTLLLSAIKPLSPVADNTGVWLHRWADETPDQVFLAERSGAGWREERYLSVLEQVRSIASSLLARELNANTPILIMSGNGVDHALLSLAAHYVGIPTVPVAEQYSLIPQAHTRLQHAIEMVSPAMAYVVDVKHFDSALQLDALKGIEIVSSRPGNKAVTSFDELLKGNAAVDVATAHSNVNADTVAKILLTSGSSSAPKGVLTTHGMMCANQTQIADALPFLRNRPPRLLDWLPWNHVFGGSHNFNMMLANGGSIYIDDGKPVKALFDRTIENLGLMTGSICFNVPVGFQMLLTALQADSSLRQRFFTDLDLIFYAGASLPQDVWEGFEKMAMDVKGEVPLMTSSWGLTETAPATLMQLEPTDRSGVVGIPLNGVVAKLIPVDEMRYEVRVKGPNIMPGYFHAPEKSNAAFDDEGFLITGDAMRFVDSNDPNRGLRFDGRMSENFKLLSGVWVRAAQLRLDILACLSPLASDVVITGADRNQIGILIFPDSAALERFGFATTGHNGALSDKRLLDELRRRLVDNTNSNTSSSSRVARALVMSAPASIGEGEITAKGNLNFTKVLTLRADLLERLYDDADAAVTIL